MVVAFIFIFGVFFFYQKRTPDLERYDLILAWLIRLAFSLLFVFIYYQYYPNGATNSDIGSCMHDSQILAQVFYQSPKAYIECLFGLESQQTINQYLSATTKWSSPFTFFIDDTKNVIRINSLLFFLSKGSVYVHLMIISFFSMLGIRELFLTFHLRIWINKRVFWYALVVLPSFAFWSSTLLKEPFLLIGLALFLRATFGDLSLKGSIWRWVVGGILMILFKPYVLLCLLSAIAIVFIARLVNKKALLQASFFVVLAALVLVVFVPKFHQQPMRFLTRKQFDFNNMAKGGVHVVTDSCFYYFTPEQKKYLHIVDSTVYLKKPIVAQKEQFGRVAPTEPLFLSPNKNGWPLYFQAERSNSYICLQPLNNSPSQLVKNAPVAFLNATFRPYFWDNGGLLKWVSIIETIVLIGFFSLSLLKKIERTESDKQTITTLLWFSILLLLLIGWITPVIGAIVRYRIPAYLALFLIAATGKKTKKLQ